MVEDSLQATKQFRENIKDMMETYQKLNLAIELAKKDAEEGVIGYDDDGQKIYDMDLINE